MSLATINKRLKEFDPRLELVRGEGYHYYVFDDPNLFQTKSVYCMYTNSMSDEDWVADGILFSMEVADEAA